MKVHTDLEILPEFEHAVLTIGAFDGVHHGHRQILQRVIDVSKSINGTSVVLTFDPHPRRVVFPNDHSLKLITTLNEKISLIAECGIDHLIIVPFTVEFSQINPYDYVEKFLIQKVNPDYLIIGYDHRFGLNRAGNIDLLRHYAKKGHFKIIEIPEREIDHLKVSSTSIRNHLQKGDVDLANKLLGKPFRIAGRIVSGTQVAGSLGFPTANVQLEVPEKIIPKSGTYAATGTIDSRTYEGMMYIGQRKTLGKNHSLSLEINLFHQFEEDLYDREIVISLYKFVRPDEYFKSKKELIHNIAYDKLETQAFFQFQQVSSTKSITIAILNWNGIDLLKQYLPGVIANSGKHTEIQVIDNHSTDGSLEYLREKFPYIKIISHTSNLGFTGGYNEALPLLSTKYVILLNNDVEVTPGWTESLYDYMEGNPEIAAIQPKIKAWHEKEKFEYAGAAGGFLDILAYPFCRGRIFDSIEYDHGQYDEVAEVFWASGAAMMVRSELLVKVGGFDRTFFAHQEEIDLCWRLKTLGYLCVCHPQSVVYHRGASSLSKEDPHKTFLNLRNNWSMILKNETVQNLLWLVPMRWILDVVFITKLLFDLKPFNAYAIIKAHFAVLGSLRHIGSERYKLRILRKRIAIGTPRLEGRMRINLPFSHFVLRKKYFHQLKT